MLTILELWGSQSERDRIDSLGRYWTIPSVKKHLALETRMDKLDCATIAKLGKREWYNFLKDEYFVWKYTTPNRLASTTKQLRKYEEMDALDELHAIKNDLFSFDLDEIRRGLTIVKRIKGLGYAGASGLLAVLFPSRSGTADQFVVRALSAVDYLPEHNMLLKMCPEDLKEQDAILLIEIMRRKATELNSLFNGGDWTPRKIDMVLWTTRS